MLNRRTLRKTSNSITKQSLGGLHRVTETGPIEEHMDINTGKRDGKVEITWPEMEKAQHPVM